MDYQIFKSEYVPDGHVHINPKTADRLEKIIAKWKETHDELKKCKEALIFYAQPENYKFYAISLSGIKPGDTIEHSPNVAWEDQGKIAREALGIK